MKRLGWRGGWAHLLVLGIASSHSNLSLSKDDQLFLANRLLCCSCKVEPRMFHLQKPRAECYFNSLPLVISGFGGELTLSYNEFLLPATAGGLCKAVEAILTQQKTQWIYLSSAPTLPNMGSPWPGLSQLPAWGLLSLALCFVIRKETRIILTPVWTPILGWGSSKWIKDDQPMVSPLSSS